MIGDVPEAEVHCSVTVPAGTVAPAPGLLLLGELGEVHWVPWIVKFVDVPLMLPQAFSALTNHVTGPAALIVQLVPVVGPHSVVPSEFLTVYVIGDVPPAGFQMSCTLPAGTLAPADGVVLTGAVGLAQSLTVKLVVAKAVSCEGDALPLSDTVRKPAPNPLDATVQTNGGLPAGLAHNDEASPPQR